MQKIQISAEAIEKLHRSVYTEKEIESGRTITVTSDLRQSGKWAMGEMTGKNFTAGDAGRVKVALNNLTKRACFAKLQGGKVVFGIINE